MLSTSVRLFTKSLLAAGVFLLAAPLAEARIFFIEPFATYGQSNVSQRTKSAISIRGQSVPAQIDFGYETKNQFGFGLAVGTAVPLLPLNLTVTADQFKAPVSLGHFHSKLLMRSAGANVRFNLIPVPLLPISPYITLGGGMAQARFDHQDNKFPLFWRAGLGINIQMLDVALRMTNYKTFTYHDPAATSAERSRIKVLRYEILMGIRF